MTVGELIERLAAFDPSLRVIARGYESGHDDVVEVLQVAIKVNANTEWYRGAHQIVIRPQSSDEPIEQAIELREGRALISEGITNADQATAESA